MGDASNSRASKGKGVFGGLLKRVTGGKNDNKEEAACTGVSLKDRFSTLKPNALPAEGAHQQRTLDDIHVPEETNDVKVIHTSAARSMRFSDRVGIDPCADSFERRISFDEPEDNEYEGAAPKAVCDHEKTTAGRYASNRIVFEEDAPCATEKKDDIRSRYVSVGHVTDTPHAADTEIHEDTVTEEPAVRTSLAERLRARLSRKADPPTAHAAEDTVRIDTETNIQCAEEQNVCASDDVPVIIDEIADEEPVTVPEIEEPLFDAVPVESAAVEESAMIPIVTDAMPIEIIEITDASPEAAPESEIPETCIEIPDEIIEGTCTEETAECIVPFAEYLALMPVADEPAPADEECDHEVFDTLIQVMECNVPVIDTVSEALMEIENDTSSYDSYDEDTDGAEQDILNILRGVIIDDVIIPAEAIRITEPPAEEEFTCDLFAALDMIDEEEMIVSPVSEEFTCDLFAALDMIEKEEIAGPPVSKEAAFDLLASLGMIDEEEMIMSPVSEDVRAEEETAEELEDNNEVCFSFLSEWNTVPSAEVRFVWG